jgi:uracil-DNA glycosylase
MTSLTKLLTSCTICESQLPQGARPVLQFHPSARILIAGQAPGRKVHDSGVSFYDASGDRLREWMAMTHKMFYDSEKIAILPMGFCYPGSGRSGHLPPRPECAVAWREQLLESLSGMHKPTTWIK